MSMAYLLQYVWFRTQGTDASEWQYFTVAAIFKQKAILGNATISACRQRIAAIPMSYFPLRLGVFTALLALVVTAAAPAHAKHAARNPNNPQQNQTQTAPPNQTVNTVPPQANQPQYGGGYVPSAYPPNGMVQQRQQYAPQYQPNAYVNTVPPNPPGAPNQYPNQVPNQGRPGNNSPASSPPSDTPGTQTSSAIGVADQYPPKPPRVSFRNGQLSIIAENSTLPDILTAIHQRTGAAMELPTTLGSERVAVKLGPASTGDVLAALLNGSHFDYIVLNRPEDPSSPERIILREKVAADPNPAANNNGYNNGYVASAQPPAYQPPEVQEMPETAPDEEVAEPESAPGQSPDANYTPPAGDQNQGKTPEQLLEELRQMQQQQRGQPQPQLQPPQPPLVDNGQPQL